jgi:hypothetical protein
MNYRNSNFQRSASPIYPPREKRLNDWQPSYPYNINNDPDKKNWEDLYMMRDLKIMETLKEIRENSAHIVQQNILIISQLARIINAGRF